MHAEESQQHDFVAPKGPRDFPEGASLEWKVILRTNYLETHLDPEDNVAFQEVCGEFNTPEVGNRMDPYGVVVLVLAHALKWPPAVRHFQSTLRELIRTKGRRPKTLVDAFYNTVLWADKKTLQEMHRILSVAGRAHAVTGLAMTACQLGITSSENPSGKTCKDDTL